MKPKIKQTQYKTYERNGQVVFPLNLSEGPDRRKLRQRCGKLIVQRELSTAELIRCMELDVVSIKSGPDLIQQIYSDMEDIKPLNIAAISAVSDYRDPVVAAVATLFSIRIFILMLF